jgi:HD-GYP domain-containing protein (c-di-GMP phosphodiesterase class II)
VYVLDTTSERIETVRVVLAQLNLTDQPTQFQTKMNNFIHAIKSNLNFYKATPLYYKCKDDSFSLYKPAGVKLPDLRVEQQNLPTNLYIRNDHKIDSIREIQKLLNEKLKLTLIDQNIDEIKDTFLKIVEESFTEPKSGSLEGLTTSVYIMINKIIESPELTKSLAMLPFKKYSIALHSVNVMALAIAYGLNHKYSKTNLRILALASLLHDVGKVQLSSEILTASQALTDEEFNYIKLHPTSGYNILKRCRFADEKISQTALLHHERINGHGYPNGIKRIPVFSQIAGIIDCYEVLINDQRPYRNTLSPYEALDVIKNEMINGKFNKSIFEKFVCSLS